MSFSQIAIRNGMVFCWLKSLIRYVLQLQHQRSEQLQKQHFRYAVARFKNTLDNHVLLSLIVWAPNTASDSIETTKCIPTKLLRDAEVKLISEYSDFFLYNFT